MDITTRYNQEKETTIQYDITELLHDDLSDYVKHKLERSNEDEVKKFLSLFPLISQEKIYIGRSFVNPISLVVGGYVKDVGRINIIEKYLADMNPPIAIRFSIKVLEE